jgi:hypothetical protein
MERLVPYAVVSSCVVLLSEGLPLDRDALGFGFSSYFSFLLCPNFLRSLEPPLLSPCISMIMILWSTFYMHVLLNVSVRLCPRFLPGRVTCLWIRIRPELFSG